MDQDSTKDGTAGGERRNWRERLGVGQDLPRISDEFQSLPRDSETAAGEAKPGSQAIAKPGTPVSRPAPMAPRYARAAAPGMENGTSSDAETHGPKPAAAVRPNAGSSGHRPWAASIQPAHKPAEAPRPQRPSGPPAPMGAAGGRPGAGKTSPSASRPTPGAQRSGYIPRPAAPQGPPRPAPTRGPAAYAQAAPAPRSVAAPSAAGNDSFGERLRAQREAAEKLAQQRLAAARDRSTRAGPDTLTMLAPGRNEATPQRKAVPQHDLQPKPAVSEQPRFTFAQEEIVAAQQETAFSPDAQPAAGSRLHPSQVPPTAALSDRGQSPTGGLHATPRGPSPEAFAGGAPDFRAEYRHEDDGMFEDGPQGPRAVPSRASAADYSAAYREFEDEFDEEEPRGGRGPLLLLASLAGVAVVSGGLIYWYQQSDATPATEVRDLPVISAPQEPAKAVPAPLPEEVQQAAQPTPRKQIYDRIIGEETLEPERIVPTEEEPQPGQILQRDQQQLPASGETRIDSQGEGPAADGGTQSTEPLPLPLPPPPGAGEQGDLLVPGMANTRTASMSPEGALPEPTELSLPAPGASGSANEAADAPQFQQAAVEPASGSPGSPSPQAAVKATELGGTSPESPSAAPATRSSIYPEMTEPLAYPDAGIASPEQVPASRIDGAELAALPEPESAVVPETEAEEPPVETPVEQTADVPLPKAKPEPPAKVKTAAKPASQAQPQRAAAPQPSGSGPVQIIPADVASGQAPAQTRAAQPQAQPSSSGTRKLGREPDPLAGGRRSSYSSGIDVAGSNPLPSEPAALQQVASIAPDRVSSQPQSAGGYVVQLASFRSESEALGEYQRLVQRHPQLVSGLGSRVTQASLGQSGSFYRLGVGPIGDRGVATKLCNDLIAAGEKDCLVRLQ